MRRWSSEEKQQMRDLDANGATPKEIAALFPGCTRDQIYRVLNPKPSTKQEKWLVDLLGTLGVANFGPPEYLVMEAVWRAFAHRTSTMMLCGDPVLNQCALYRAQHGERL